MVDRTHSPDGGARSRYESRKAEELSGMKWIWRVWSWIRLPPGSVRRVHAHPVRKRILGMPFPSIRVSNKPGTNLPGLKKSFAGVTPVLTGATNGGVSRRPAEAGHLDTILKGCLSSAFVCQTQLGSNPSGLKSRLPVQHRCSRALPMVACRVGRLRGPSRHGTHGMPFLCVRVSIKRPRSNPVGYGKEIDDRRCDSGH